MGASKPAAATTECWSSSSGPSSRISKPSTTAARSQASEVVEKHHRDVRLGLHAQAFSRRGHVLPLPLAHLQDEREVTAGYLVEELVDEGDGGRHR